MKTARMLLTQQLYRRQTGDGELVPSEEFNRFRRGQMTGWEQVKFIAGLLVSW